MALVCDIKSNTPQEPNEKTKEEQDLEDGEIEDDEEELSTVPPEPPKPEPLPPVAAKDFCEIPIEKEKKRDKSERTEKRKYDEKGRKHMTEAERSILHLRKKEEMQRKKWEKLRTKEPVVDTLDDDFAKNIEKTLATILSKKEKEAAAMAGGEEKEKDKTEEKRGKKRKKNEKERKNKQRRIDSPKSEIDENEMINMRGGNAETKFEEIAEPTRSEESYESEYSSDPNRSEDKLKKRDTRKGKRNRDRGRRDRNKSRDKDRDKKNNDQPLKDSQGVCVFYLQGKCQKDDCPYSHEAVPPMKLELCKFYLMDCCAKGDKCSYMHSEFPCKFYHTGLKCLQGDECKFAHGKALSDGLKQILFKHIETAPRDILGGFPRMSREEALNMINTTQSKLQEQHGAENKQDAKGGIPSLFDISVPVPLELLQGIDDGKCKSDKPGRNRPSRWQDPDPITTGGKDFPLKPFNFGKDQDMRINSNGDIDMRTLPPTIPNITPSKMTTVISAQDRDIDLERYKCEAGLINSPPKQDLDIRTTTLLPFPVGQDIDIRQQPILASKDIDIRQIPNVFDNPAIANSTVEHDTEDEPMLQIDTGEEDKYKREEENDGLPVDIPKTQRDLFLRIQAQQKENVVDTEMKEEYKVDENINWYSDDDDDDDNRLTIKVDNDDFKDKEEASEPNDDGDQLMSPPRIKPQDVVEKLGDLSKIDISAEVTKLLTSMSQNRNQFPFPKQSTEVATPVDTSQPAAINDPRTARQDPRVSQDKSETHRTESKISIADPRQRKSSTETRSKSDKVSIYEQGSIDRNTSAAEEDTDLRGIRSDVDLRNLQLPFKGMQNYTPASEIDASINSHPPISWKVVPVEIPRPDYTGLKLSISDAEKTGDPRLRKIFRLSTEERDTPLSPKTSPKASSSGRVDPRLRKTEETKTDLVGPLNFTQQMNMLRSSAFYQSLTSNQKVLLNQELSQRSDPSNSHDPVLHNLLSNLDIAPGPNMPTHPSLNVALSILSNSSTKMNPLVGQNQPLGQMVQSITQPGLLGAAPGIPNLPPDFPMNFDMRNGGLLGNVPMSFGGYPPPEGPCNFPFNDDFYPPDNGGNFQGGNRDNRGFNRDRRRGRSNFHNRSNTGNRNFRNNRNNRSNRTHSPP